MVLEDIYIHWRMIIINLPSFVQSRVSSSMKSMKRRGLISGSCLPHTKNLYFMTLMSLIRNLFMPRMKGQKRLKTIWI